MCIKTCFCTAAPPHIILSHAALDIERGAAGLLVIHCGLVEVAVRTVAAWREGSLPGRLAAFHGHGVALGHAEPLGNLGEQGVAGQAACRGAGRGAAFGVELDPRICRELERAPLGSRRGAKGDGAFGLLVDQRDTAAADIAVDLGKGCHVACACSDALLDGAADAVGAAAAAALGDGLAGAPAVCHGVDG